MLANLIAGALVTSYFLYIVYICLSLLLGAIGGTTLAWMLHAWWTPRSLARSRLPSEDLQPEHSFSLIVPARHEEVVLAASLERMAAIDHPEFEVLVVLGDDDPGTYAIARDIADRHPKRIKLVMDDSSPKSKPKALNAALPHCQGTVTGVFDAEDLVHPSLLRRVDQCFERTGADVVQAGVQLMNFRSSWLTVRNVLEYYFWFRSRLHLHARQRFIPLGGNTVFLRTDVLRAVSGWDPDCLAEDCELGVRLSGLGAQTAVFYEPELVTREECPPTLSAFVRQRTRWNQGYLQTLAKGYWRGLPPAQRALGVYILAMPYALALAWLMLPISIATALLIKAPIGITLISFLPALPMVSVLVVEVAGLGDFCRTYGERPRVRDYVRLILGLPLYQAVLAYAAARAVAREITGQRGWEKTAHHGLHLHPEDVVAEAPAMPERKPGAKRRKKSRAANLRRGEANTGRGSDLGLAGSAQPALALAGIGPRASAARLAGHWPKSGRGLDPLWMRLRTVAASGVRNPAVNADPAASGQAPVGRLRSTRWLSLAAVGAHVDVVLPVLLIISTGLVMGINLLHWPIEQFDEGTYIANAWALQHGRLAPYTYSYGHPPLGWLLIFLWTKLGGLLGAGSFSVDSSREQMLVINAISCWLLYTLARRLRITPAIAAVTVLLFALSPLAIFFHRAVLLDNPSIAWALAAFVLVLTPERRLAAFAAGGACFAASVLSKETSFVLLPAFAYAAVQNADRRTARYCLILVGSFFLVIAFVYPLYAILKGELVPGHGHVSLIGYAVVQLLTRQGTGSVFDPHSPTHAIVVSWLKLDPWLLVAGIGLFPLALLRRPLRPFVVAFLLQCLTVLRPGYLPNMYVIGMLPFAALIVGGSADVLWRTWRRMEDRGTAWLLAPYILVPAVIAANSMAVSWIRGDITALSARPDTPIRAAESWAAAHISHQRRVIVTDDFWIYLIEHGFNAGPVKGGFYSRTVISYWPLDFDPAVKRHFPHGWRDFDYVISDQDMRVTMANTPTAAAAVARSRVVASFGRGKQVVQIRAITDHLPGIP